MTDYILATREFGLSEKGVHLLRSGYNYETIDFNNIRELTIKKGKEVNNWILLLTIGAAMLLFSIWYSVRLFTIVDNDEVNVFYIEEIVVPVIPFLLGLYFIYSSTKTGTIMSLTIDNGKRKRYPLGQLETANNLDELKLRLKEKLTTRFKTIT